MPATLITGAFLGIGRAFAYLLARDGFDLVLTARSQNQLDTLAVQLRESTGRIIVTIPQDLSQPGAADAIFQQVSRSGLPVEVLINNAGLGCWAVSGK
jgi:uncharacterized protein